MSSPQRTLAQVILRNPHLESWECLRFVPPGYLTAIANMSEDELVACGVMRIFVEATTSAAEGLARGLATIEAGRPELEPRRR
jgi:hypothetical protein